MQIQSLRNISTEEKALHRMAECAVLAPVCDTLPPPQWAVVPRSAGAASTHSLGWPSSAGRTMRARRCQTLLGALLGHLICT